MNDIKTYSLSIIADIDRLRNKVEDARKAVVDAETSVRKANEQVTHAKSHAFTSGPSLMEAANKSLAAATAKLNNAKELSSRAKDDEQDLILQLNGLIKRSEDLTGEYQTAKSDYERSAKNTKDVLDTMQQLNDELTALKHGHKLCCSIIQKCII